MNKYLTGYIRGFADGYKEGMIKDIFPHDDKRAILHKLLDKMLDDDKDLGTWDMAYIQDNNIRIKKYRMNIAIIDEPQVKTIDDDDDIPYELSGVTYGQNKYGMDYREENLNNK